MRKQAVQRRHSLLLGTVAAVILIGASGSVFAQGVGKKYGSRDPRKCDDMKAPARGAITAALAAKYFICAAERQDGHELYLVENVKVEVGAGRPYNPNMDLNVPEIDVRFPLYPIRGSHTQYQCKQENAQYDFTAPGKNCNRYEHQNAKGFCYKTTFGDWRCYQTDLSIPNENITMNVPPPKGDKAAAVNKTAANDKPADTKDVRQPAETNTGKQPAERKDAPNADRDENGIVKPDFSELEKDYEIVRYEYDTSTRPPAIYIVARVKKPTGGALRYEGLFYDADGVNIMIPSERVWAIGGDTSKVGEVVKLRVWTPSEKQMRDVVKKIVVARKIE